jgi:hypothetical protein
MTSVIEDAESLATGVAILAVLPALLWMVGNMGSMSTRQAVGVAVEVITTLAVPSFVLIGVFACVLWLLSLAN